jgi:predicted Zn-dependent peptidase
MTCFSSYSLEEHLPLAMDVIADIMINSVFDEKEITKEKKVVIEEISSSEDIPEELAQDSFSDMLLNPHPESKPILGTRKTVSSFKREDIIDYISKYYSSSNIVISAAGNLDHDKFLDFTLKLFDFNACQKKEYFINKPIKITSIKSIRKNIGQSHICIGGLTFGYNSWKRYPLLVLITYHGYGMTSRLYQNIREKYGLTYSIYSCTDLFREIGLIATYAATDPQNIEKTLQLIRKEYNDLKTKFLDKEIIDLTKSQIKGSLILSHESTIDRMNRIAKGVIYHDQIYDIDDVISKIDAVNPDDIKIVADEIFNEENLRTLIVTSCATC